MAWVRGGTPPEQIKISFVVSSKEHPELAKFIWSLPYRGASKILRDILSAAVVASKSTDKHADDNAPMQAGHLVRQQSEHGIPTQNNNSGVSDVSAAAASIMSNFDKMFS